MDSIPKEQLELLKEASKKMKANNRQSKESQDNQGCKHNIGIHLTTLKESKKLVKDQKKGGREANSQHI